jgi:DNA repair protein RecN (Recombination protein N)
VRGLGVIDDLTVTFGPGMTAVTGETGTGKTLLVEALHLVLGGRASPSLVRDGADEVLVEARFVMAPAPEDSESEVVLARSVPASGRSRSWRDGRMVPLTGLAESGADLVDIYGQHDHQALLSPAAQRRILDEYCGSDLSPRRNARRALRELEDAIAALGGSDAERSREADVLRHQLREIDGATISDPEEEVHLREERDRLAELAEHRGAVASILASFEGDAGGAGSGADEGVLSVLARSAEALGSMRALSGWADRVRAAVTDLGDVASELRHATEAWEDDPDRLDQVHRRLQQLAELRRKYGPSLPEVLAFAERARQRLELLDRAEATAADLTERRRAAVVELHAAEDELRATRRDGAAKFATLVEERLRDLAMPHARFTVVVGTGGDPSGPGTEPSEGQDRAGDRVRFLLGANPGEPVQELLRVASGGELSRTMLAIRLVASGGPDTMVFDEVDSGVGGEAARSLARALTEVARHRQVLVVTHLPQVAAAADSQITVRKVLEGGRTVTEVHVLDAEERVVELSRMLSGHPDSPTARAHAEELLAMSAREDPSTMSPGRVD